MSRKPKAAPKGTFTKRQLARWQKEKRRRRILQIVILVAIAAILGVIVYGLYDNYYRPWRQPILRVNDRVFDMDYYVKMLRIWGAEGDSSEDMELAYTVVEAMKYYELYRQAADELDITISDESIDAKAREYLSISGETSIAEEVRRLYRVSESDFKRMLIEPALALQPALQNYIGDTEYPEDKEYEHVYVQAMLLGTEEEALEIAERWAIGESFAQLAEDSSKSIEGWRPRGIEESPVFDDFAFRLEIGGQGGPIRDTNYSTRGGYWLVRILDQDEEGSLYIQAMLLDSEHEAEKIAKRVDADEDFAQLAEEYSMDSASKYNGGNLGWLTPETAESKFGQAIFALALNELSEPIYQENVSKQSGYWLIRVLDKDDRTLSYDHRDSLTSEAFNDWIQARMAESRIKDYSDYERVIWALDHL